MIKAIETIYNGYRFRSRLEARWAVFFDKMGIPYEYEKEGYDLDGTRYLPDFWLPSLDCWIEIKGAFPTCKEVGKAFFLAWYTEKITFICPGNIVLPGSGSGVLKLGGFAVKIKGEEGMHEGSLASFKEIFPEISSSLIKKGVRCIDEIRNEIKQYFNDPHHNDDRHCDDVYLMQMYQAWTECPFCHKIEITSHGLLTRMSCHCMELNEQGKEEDKEYHNVNSPRLIAAYTAARQARFEHGEKP